MKILVLFCSQELTVEMIKNLRISLSMLSSNGQHEIECALLVDDPTNIDLFKKELPISTFFISPCLQLTKICDFITTNLHNLNYDWYVKLRPGITILEEINFELLNKNAINARSRVYIGSQQIQYGKSVNGPGLWARTPFSGHYDQHKEYIILDDMVFIMHHQLIQQGVFTRNYQPVSVQYSENEWFHNNFWKSKQIKKNVIGINLRQQRKVSKINLDLFAFSGNTLHDANSCDLSSETDPSVTYDWHNMPEGTIIHLNGKSVRKMN